MKSITEITEKIQFYITQITNSSAGRWILAIISVIVAYFILNYIFNKIKKTHYFLDNKKAKIFLNISKFFIYFIIILLALENLGVEIVSILAGLGIGGIAVALAAQKILGDLFTSISIIIDKPFEVGDLINVNSNTGTVESIGIKTTKIRSVNGEQIILSNQVLMDNQISNLKRMRERRVILKISIVNDKKDNLQEVIEIVKSIIDKQDGARFDRGHLVSFSASSIDYEFVYWITKPDYLPFMDIQQRTNLDILKAFTEKKIKLAHEVQKLLLANS